MYRAVMYGEGHLLDAQGNLLVDDLDDYQKRHAAKKALNAALKKFHATREADATLGKLFSDDVIAGLREVKDRSSGGYERFIKDALVTIKPGIVEGFEKLYSVRRIGIQEAEEKLKKYQESLG